MRTDIPAFYSKWFLNRIREGFVYVRNPYNESQVTEYKLTHDVVDMICFCTKNPLPLLPYMEEFDDFRQFWFVTITAYGKDYEPNVPDKEKVIEGVKTLSKKLGKDAVGWRYDPIFYSEVYDQSRHIQEFSKIAKSLKGHTNQCVISFLDMYEKVKVNVTGIRPPTKEEQLSLVEKLVKIAKENDITIRSCCESAYLEKLGVDISGCQTKEVLEKASGLKLNPPNKKNARKICNCLLGQDIGTYNCCGHLCKYCYANSNRNLVLQNMKRHNPNSPLLIGNLQKGDKITKAIQKSYAVSQISMF